MVNAWDKTIIQEIGDEINTVLKSVSDKYGVVIPSVKITTATAAHGGLYQGVRSEITLTNFNIGLNPLEAGTEFTEQELKKWSNFKNRTTNKVIPLINLGDRIELSLSQLSKVASGRRYLFGNNVMPTESVRGQGFDGVRSRVTGTDSITDFKTTIQLTGRNQGVNANTIIVKITNDYKMAGEEKTDIGFIGLHPDEISKLFDKRTILSQKLKTIKTM
jgi:hypothetical protein